MSVIINKVVNAINKHGHDIDIAAYKGNTFLGMTWSAVVLVFLAGIAWTCEFVVGRRHNSSHGKEEHY